MMILAGRPEWPNSLGPNRVKILLYENGKQVGVRVVIASMQSFQKRVPARRAGAGARQQKSMLLIFYFGMATGKATSKKTKPPQTSSHQQSGMKAKLAQPHSFSLRV